MPENVGYVYKITSPSKRVYIGQTSCLRTRLSDYKKLKCTSQKLLYKSFLKYGFDQHDFEVIETVPTQQLLEREIYWIGRYSSNKSKYKNGFGMNLTDGGEGTLGLKWNDESRKKFSEARVGVKFSETHLENMSKVRKGILHSEERKSKHPLKGKKLSPEHIKKLHPEGRKYYNPNPKGSSLTQEHKNRVSKSLMGHLVDDITKYKISQSQKNLLLLDTITGIYYEGLPSTAKIYSINKGTLYDQLIGRTKKQTTNLQIV